MQVLWSAVFSLAYHHINSFGHFLHLGKDEALCQNKGKFVGIGYREGMNRRWQNEPLSYGLGRARINFNVSPLQLGQKS